jgi:NADH dehydrogenase FAD-containing subunit
VCVRIVYDLFLDAEKKFARDSINVITNTRVMSVNTDSLELFDKSTKTKTNLPYGMCVWSTGNKMLDISKSLASKLPNQNNSIALITDDAFQVRGAENIFAIGDCGTIDQRKLIHDCTELFSKADANGDGKLSPKEFEKFIESNSNVYPQMKFLAKEALRNFKKFDTSGDGYLDIEEFQKLLAESDKKITSLPPTAQVAGQTGEHLAKNLNKSKLDPFKYIHRGSFSYIGGSESALEANGFSFTGFFTYLAWSSVYWNKQVSLRNKYCLLSDWAKARLFGRDISRI